MANRNESRAITTQSNNKHISKLLTAVDLAFNEETQLADDVQFGFRMILQSGTVVLENSNPFNNNNGFDMEFDVPFDDDLIANEAEFVVFNLTDNTINKLKVGNAISLKAGYGDDVGVAFEGYISKVKTVQEGVDKITTISALDDVKYTPQMMKEKTFSKGTTASTILRDLLNRLGLEIAVFKPKRDHTYDSETKVSGGIVENIDKYSEVCGISTYVYKQKIYSRPIKEGDNLHFNISCETGMIDSPEPYEEEYTSEKYVDTVTGYSIKMIFQHRMATAGIVKVDSKYCKGEYRVASGKHTYDGLSATTEIKCIDTIKTKESTE